MKKNALFLTLSAAVLLANIGCSRKVGEKTELLQPSAKSSAVLPAEIQENVPEEMQNIVFLQFLFSFLKNEYVSEIADSDMMEKIISTLLPSLDPHSSYLNEKAFAALKNQIDGEFGGLGIEIMIDEGFIRVISPVDDTPAYKAGLKSGDLIIYIDDECINGVSSEEALGKLRGKPGTKVKLKIKRNNKLPFDVTIEREIIKVQSVKAEILDRIAYVRISTFDANTSKNLLKFLKDNLGKIDGIVMDLRNNPGGLLEECVALADMFLKKGQTIVSIRGRTEENTRKYESKSGDITKGIPIVVIINSATASAPEILAAALTENKRGISVGTRSFGKGTVQKVFQISETTAVKITIAKYYTPSGKCIQADGITPDITADSATIDKHGVFCVREESLINAIDAGKKVENKKKTDEENKKALDALSKSKKKEKGDDEEVDSESMCRALPLAERVEKDYQLNKAFDIIKVANLSETCKNTSR